MHNNLSAQPSIKEFHVQCFRKGRSLEKSPGGKMRVRSVMHDLGGKDIA